MSILSNWCVSLQVDPIISTTARSSISSSQRCLFHPSPSCLCFPALPPLFLQGLRFLNQVSFYSCEVSPIFSFMFLLSDSQEDSNGASSLWFFVLLSSPVCSMQSFDGDHILFLVSNAFLMPVHLIIIHFPLFNCSGVLKISRRFVFPLCFHSSSFEDVISFKPFNSTSAISPSNRSMVLFFWVGPNPQVFS